MMQTSTCNQIVVGLICSYFSCLRSCFSTAIGIIVVVVAKAPCGRVEGLGIGQFKYSIKMVVQLNNTHHFDTIRNNNSFMGCFGWQR